MVNSNLNKLPKEKLFCFSDVLARQKYEQVFYIQVDGRFQSFGKFKERHGYKVNDANVIKKDLNINENSSNKLAWGGGVHDTYLLNHAKQEIIKKLKDYVVASVTPEIIDPSILYIELDSVISYKSSKTTETKAEISKKVTTAVDEYTASSQTEKFDGKFRHSKYAAVIDGADSSITSNVTNVTLRKDFYPTLNSTFYYELCFLNAFKDSCDDSIMKSCSHWGKDMFASIKSVTSRNFLSSLKDCFAMLYLMVYRQKQLFKYLFSQLLQFFHVTIVCHWFTL